jgi:hypothetical protein
LKSRLDEPRNRSARCGDEIKLLRLPRIEPRFLGCPNRSPQSAYLLSYIGDYFFNPSNNSQVQQLHISEEVGLHIVTHNSVYAILYYFIKIIIIDGQYFHTLVHTLDGDVIRNDTATYNCQLHKVNIMEHTSYLKTAKYIENP